MTISTSRHYDQSGFTLIELLVSMAIAAIILTGIYSTYKVQHKAYIVQEQVADMQQRIRGALLAFTNDFRMAGFDPTEGAGAAGILAARPDLIFFSRDLDNSGAIEAGTEETVAYYLDTNWKGIQTLYRHSGADPAAAPFSGGTKQPLIQYAEALDLVYLDADNSALDDTDVDADGEWDNDDPADIRSVEVTLVVRSFTPDRDFNDSSVYRNLRGEVIHTAPGDQFRRRALSRQVLGRNLGLGTQ